ncbi:MAG: iron-containing alcohol dehydrogenase family protein [Candidatus Latescibacterota bacterium]
MARNFGFHMPTEVVFGEGVVDRTGEHAARLGKCALIVTGRRSARESGALGRVEASLAQAGVSSMLFDRVTANPSIELVAQGEEVASAAEVDLVVALGGGSAMDAGKAIAILATNGGSAKDYFGMKTYACDPLPILAIPTTSGTGSEVTPYAVLTDMESRDKKSLASPTIFPRIALADPELTCTMSPEITVDTGIDALTHAAESYLSNRATPLSDELALESIRLIYGSLERACYDGEDLGARSTMLYASMLAGMCIAQTGTTMLHSMGYPLTVFHGISHGRANGILLPYVLAFDREATPEKMDRIAEIFGGTLDAVRGFGEKLGLSADLSLLLPDANTFEEMTDHVMAAKNLANNPRPVTRSDVEEIWQRACSGRLG